MNEEYTYDIDKYTVGVDKNGTDGIGLTVAILNDGNWTIIGTCYGEQARFINMLIKNNQKLQQERNNYKELYEKEKGNWNELKEWLEEEISQCGSKYDRWGYEECLDKMQEIERL